jgi:hypothetical protein
MTPALLLACRLALVVPLCAATAVALMVAVGERAGAAPFAGTQARNSAEAAGLARAGEVLRFLRNGEDPRRVHPVHPDVISGAVTQATTLEAAMWSRQLELVQLLDRVVGYRDEERRALACLGADLEIEDVVEYLAPGGTAHCEPGKALDRVMARSRSR